MVIHYIISSGLVAAEICVLTLDTKIIHLVWVGWCWYGLSLTQSHSNTKAAISVSAAKHYLVDLEDLTPVLLGK